MAKYDSCSRAHRSQKGTPWISTTARRRQGRSVLLPTWHSPSFVASIFSKSSTTTVRVLGVGNAGAARTTTVNDAVGTVSLRYLFSCPSLGDCCSYYKPYHIIVTSVTLCGLRHCNILTRKVPGPYEEPRQVRAAQLLPVAPSRGNQLPSSRHKLCCRREAEQGKEFWRRLFGDKISCDGGDTPGADSGDADIHSWRDHTCRT